MPDTSPLTDEQLDEIEFWLGPGPYTPNSIYGRTLALVAEVRRLRAADQRVRTLAGTPETDQEWEPGDRGPGFYRPRMIRPAEIRAALDGKDEQR